MFMFGFSRRKARYGVVLAIGSRDTAATVGDGVMPDVRFSFECSCSDFHKKGKASCQSSIAQEKQKKQQFLCSFLVLNQL